MLFVQLLNSLGVDRKVRRNMWYGRRVHIREESDIFIFLNNLSRHQCIWHIFDTKSQNFFKIRIWNTVQSTRHIFLKIFIYIQSLEWLENVFLHDIYIFFFLCIKSNSSNKKKMVNFFLGRKYYCFTMIRSKLNFFQDIFIIIFILNTTRYKLYLKKKKIKFLHYESVFARHSSILYISISMINLESWNDERCLCNQ